MFSDDAQKVFGIISSLCQHMGQPIERTALNLGAETRRTSVRDECDLLKAAGLQVGLYIKETRIRDVDELTSLVSSGFPIVLFDPDTGFYTLEVLTGRNLVGNQFGSAVGPATLSRSTFKSILAKFGARVFVVKQELECQSISSSNDQVVTPHTVSIAKEDAKKPLRRFLGLLRFDVRDIILIALFGLVAGVLTLAAPLAVESLVNVVSWGTYVQPLVVLASFLMACMVLAGIFTILQIIIAETIQRRQLVRLVGDFAHRFPRANREYLKKYYPRELANRYFDIVTLQKSSATLLLDGISIVLATVTGMLLLAFYHPFLLGFDIILLISMVTFTWLFGRNGIRTAVKESATKYKIAHWLQDILDSPTAFKLHGGEGLAIDRANRFVSEYLNARQAQFRVILRQVIFAISLQAIASTALLGLGGWLVMRQQLTLGQLVASELVITVIVGAFAKAGKSIEKFYDAVAGVDKLGYLLDIEVDQRVEPTAFAPGPAEVCWRDFEIKPSSGGKALKMPSQVIEAGSVVGFSGNLSACKTSLLYSLAGLHKPKSGLIEIAGLPASDAATTSGRSLVSLATWPQNFHGTIQENIDLGRVFLGYNEIREALVTVGLWDELSELPNGLETKLLSNGYPLSLEQNVRLSIARAIIDEPRVLLIDGILDVLPPQERLAVFNRLKERTDRWTIFVCTHDEAILSACSQTIECNG